MPNHDDCQLATNCQIPTCGMNTHFSSVCLNVYGLDGYRHFDKKLLSSGAGNSKGLNVNRREFQSAVQRNSNPTLAVGSNMRGNDRITCALPTVMGYIRYGTKKTMVRILLDTGSQISLLREGIVPKSHCGQMQDFSLTTVGGDTLACKLRVVDCTLASLDGSFQCDVRLTEMKRPCGDAPIIGNAQIRQYLHLDDISIVEAPDKTIDILLGIENGDILTADERILGPTANDPVVVRCPLGWYVQGGHSSSEVLCNATVHFTQVTAISEIEDFLGIDRVGIEPRRCKCTMEDQDKIANDSMQQSVTRLEDGTYQISLPWRKSPQGLPNNHDYAVKRFLNLEKQFKNKPRQWEVYCKQMEDQVKRGVARVVSADEMANDAKASRKMWFLPHFGVLKDSQTTPVRVVYDGKATYQGHSLNDYLAKGNNMNSNLFEVALRFREYEVGVIADISKMFQAVKVHPDDARFHRYIFRERPEDPIRVYELTTVTFGDKPSPAAAIIALRHVAKENAPNDPDVQRVIADQFYVDDLTDSERTVEKTRRLQENLTATLGSGGFRIRKWLSNKGEICDKEYYPADGNTTVLGTKWNLTDDTLQAKEVTFDDFMPTKRNILKKTASYYDIFGMLSGILVRPKILLQKLWTFDNIDWDTPIHSDSDIHIMLEAVKEDLKDVNTTKIERCLIPEKFRGKSPMPSVSLHGASDASDDAMGMGMGIWLRWSEAEDDDAELTFLCARARLTPLKQLSIPRKELQAILLLSRLMTTVENALRLEIAYRRIWTDSMTAISWLRGQSKSFRSYVACRVGEITADFDPNDDISYVPTDQNTIDLVSRGVNATEMQKVIDGPTFLKKPPAYWPETPKNVPVDREDTELKKFHVRNAKVLTLQLSKAEPVVDPKKFSSWSRLVMVTARILSLKDCPRASG
ncbi:PREDICTED: uncharacterized protein LOC106815968 [Priapulus caudatus]|uniref:Uncharacterized protein LOC106815968 n=1 Tax=Priapulus caudatus TaxID=37621 RepID=A0ABM1EUX0_PRICU|nr:PREDICTED: uncharacterized protein LOC106815968 [Priapulus caudatus]